MTCDVPPATSTRLSFRATLSKNPTVRLSGDQNGASPFSVPGSGKAVSVSRRRSQIC